MHRRAQKTLGVWGLAVATLAGTVTWVSVPLVASASVGGRQGIEIEGARDRRGFFVGGGLGFGGTFFWVNEFGPAMRVDLALGGGVTRRLTLGADLHVTPYLSRSGGVGFGGDVEATGYVFRGLYLRAALGVGGVPKRSKADPDADGITTGLGGAFGFGYEFFLNASAAMSAGFTYDARFVSGTRFPRQSLLVGLRFSFY